MKHYNKIEVNLVNLKLKSMQLDKWSLMII